MPPSKRWDASAERDLCIAMIMSGQDAERAKHNWPAIHAFMYAIGYKFTKDALSQHFSKKVLKEFRDRHASPATPKKKEADTGESKSSLPSPTVKAVTTPSSRKRAPNSKKAPASKEVPAPDDDDDDLGNAGDVPGLASPTKKIKLEEGNGDHKEMEEVEVKFETQ